MKQKAFLILILVLFSGFLAQAQSPKNDTIPVSPRPSETPVDKGTEGTGWLGDTTSSKRKHSPKKATLLSAVVPGLGQVYNRQYYKVPIIAGFAVFFGIMITTNDFDYTQANGNYRTRLRNELRPAYGTAAFPEQDYDYYDPNIPDIRTTGRRTYTTNELRLIRDGFRRDRDFYIIMSTLVYALNIVDAAVFAHFREFEINNKMSVRLDPDFRLLAGNSSPVTGLSLSFNFHQKNRLSYAHHSARLW